MSDTTDTTTDTTSTDTTSTDTTAPTLHEQVDIAAPADVVWALVADVTRMAEWSPQVTSTRLAEPDQPAGVGTRFTNRNAHGELAWTTHARITRYDVGRSLSFRVEENWTTWSFELVPTVEGTRLHQRREAPEGISALARELTDAFMGGQEAFTATQRSGMQQTLAAIRAAAEGAGSPT